MTLPVRFWGHGGLTARTGRHQPGIALPGGGSSWRDHGRIMAEGGGEGKGKTLLSPPRRASRAEGLNQGEGGGLFRWSETADGDVSSTPDWPRRLGQCRATRAAQPLTIAATPTRPAIARRGVAAAGAGANLPVTTAGLGLVAWVESQCWERKLRVGYEGGGGSGLFCRVRVRAEKDDCSETSPKQKQEPNKRGKEKNSRR